MYTVYVIRNGTSKIYIGQTQDLVKRLARHNSPSRSKRGSYTKLQKGPWNIVYTEHLETRIEAIRREKYLKSHHGRDWLKSVLLGP